jgi:hypothetical protein
MIQGRLVLLVPDVLVALFILVAVFGVLWGVARAVTQWSLGDDWLITLGSRLAAVLAGIAASSLALSPFGIGAGPVPVAAIGGLVMYCLACLLYRQDRRELAEFYE